MLEVFGAISEELSASAVGRDFMSGKEGYSVARGTLVLHKALLRFRGIYREEMCFAVLFKNPERG